MTVTPVGRRLLRLEVRNEQSPIESKPPWIRTKMRMGPEYQAVSELVAAEGLHTVLSVRRLEGCRHTIVIGDHRSIREGCRPSRDHQRGSGSSGRDLGCGCAKQRSVDGSDCIAPFPVHAPTRARRCSRRSQAAWRYSWMSPPRISTRSIRSTSRSAPTRSPSTLGVGTGMANPRPRCGRAVL
jgi:hypothetical protein